LCRDGNGIPFSKKKINKSGKGQLTLQPPVISEDGFSVRSSIWMEALKKTVVWASSATGKAARALDVGKT
jgi:hypothetical protein